MTGPGSRPLTDEARYQPVLSVRGWSPTLRSIWRDAYGDEYPAEAEPLGFSTLTDLQLIARWLSVGPGDTFVDLGCGRGGPGLWLARETSASLIGIDIVPEAVAEANRRIPDFSLHTPPRFQVGSFTRTGLPDQAFEGAVSIDSLWIVIDKAAAMREVARILIPGARWVCSTWEPRYLSYRQLLNDCGWEVLECREPVMWYARQMAVYQGILRSGPDLAAELGQDAADVLLAEARDIAPVLRDYRRLLIICRR